MKQKYSEAGFSMSIILIFIVVMSVTGFGGWYVLRHQANTSDTAEIDDSSNFMPGRLVVIFKDGVTLDQALALIHSQKLTVENPEDYFRDFTPESYRGIKKEKFAGVLEKLQKYPEVDTATNDSADPSNNRAGNDEYWLKIVWQQNVSFDRIKQIEIEAGVGAPTQPSSATRTIYLTVPEGQEKLLIDVFKRSPIVQSAEQLGQPTLQR